MDRSQRLARWFFIFLALIIFIFWRENFGDGMEALGKDFLLLLKKIMVFFEEKILPIYKNFAEIFLGSDNSFDKIPRVTKDPFLQTVFSILYCICIVILYMILGALSICFFIFWVLSSLLFWIIKGIGWCINDGLTKIKIYSLTGYILSLFVLSYISGRFFHSIIFPWLCQWGEIILALTLGRFFYQLRRERRERKLEEIKEGYVKKKDKVEDLRNTLIKLTEAIDPELLGFIPTETFKYEGWPKEMYKRLKIRQREKTAKVVSAHLDALREVWEKWGSICQAIANYELSVYRLSNLSEEIAMEEAIKNKKKKAELEKIDLEEKMERLKLEKQIIQLEREIEKIKNISFDDEYIQKTKNIINELKAKGAGVKMASEEREKILSDPELQKDRKTYQRVKNMWDNAIIELLERK